MYRCTLTTPLGTMLATAHETALTGLWFTGQKHYPENTEALPERAELPLFQKLDAWIAAYFKGGNPPLTIPLKPEGTPFRLAVWDILRTIPYGTTISYGAVAARTGSSARASGGAVGRNPISLLIPCHRVIGADGGLTGYAGGIERKKKLLELEKILPVS